MAIRRNTCPASNGSFKRLKYNNCFYILPSLLPDLEDTRLNPTCCLKLVATLLHNMKWQQDLPSHTASALISDSQAYQISQLKQKATEHFITYFKTVLIHANANTEAVSVVMDEYSQIVDS